MQRSTSLRAVGTERIRRVLIIGVVAAAGCTSTNASGGNGAGPAEPTSSVSDTSTTASSTSVSARPPAPSWADEAQSTLADIVSDEDGGVAVVWRRDGERLQLAAGVADDTGTPMTPDLPFRVGSISKTFVAVMVLQLHDEGLVDVDAPLATYLPGIEPYGDLTVRALLSHRSGIPSYTDQPAYLRDTFIDPTRAFTPEEILGYVDGLVAGDDGSFAYSNTNYVLLGLLIEAIDQRSLGDSLRHRITEPLGIAQTRFAGAADPATFGPIGGWSSSTAFDGDPNASYTALATSAWAAGALVSTSIDLATFLEALFEGGLVSDLSLQQMTDTGRRPYGLGLFVASLGSGSIAFGHNGLIPGFSSTMAYEPTTGDLIVVLTNNDSMNADLVASALLIG